MIPAPSLNLWLEVFLALGAGGTVVVGLAALVCRRLRAAAWRRTVWQICLVALLALLLAEVTGTGRSIVELSRSTLRLSSESGSPSPGPPLQPADCSPSPAERSIFPPPQADAGATHAQAAELLEPELELPRLPSRELPRALLERLEHRSTLAPPGDRATWLPGFIWCAGVLLLGARRICGSIFLLRRCRRWQCGHDAVQERAERIARRLGMRHRPALRITPGLSAPIAFGIRRPTIGVPPGFVLENGPAEQDVMLAHEIAHLAARDPAWQLLAGVVAALLWWHPLVWWARKELRAAGELAADEASLVVENGPFILAACLVEAGKRQILRRAAVSLGMDGSNFRSILGRRVERLLNATGGVWKPPRRAYSCVATTVGPTLLVLGAIFSSAWARPRAREAQETSRKGDLSMAAMTQNIWQRSLAGIAFMAALGTGPGETSAQVSPENAGQRPPPAPAQGRQYAPRSEDRKALQQQEEEIQALRAELEALKKDLLDARLYREDEEAPKDFTAKKRSKSDPKGFLKEHQDFLKDQQDFLKEHQDYLKTHQEAQKLFMQKGPATAEPQDVFTRKGPAATSPYPPAGAAGVPPYQNAPAPAMGASGYVDLVNLASTLLDAEADLKRARVQSQRVSQLADTGVVSQRETSLAAIDIETAERKVKMLRRMVEIMLRRADAAVTRLSSEKERLELRYSKGYETEAPALQAVEAQIAAERMNIEFLRSMLDEASTPSSSASSAK